MLWVTNQVFCSQYSLQISRDKGLSAQSLNLNVSAKQRETFSIGSQWKKLEEERNTMFELRSRSANHLKQDKFFLQFSTLQCQLAN
jgi:hypothetical protein